MTWNKKEKLDFIKLYPTTTNIELSKIFNKTYSAIKSMGTKLKLKKNSQLICKRKLKNLLNESIESYYWLGYLMADGSFCKNVIKVYCAEKDLSHMKKYAKYVNYHISKTIIKNKIYYYVCIADKSTSSRIKEIYNISGNKTENPCFINEICSNKEMFLSWFAGFFDGDGCIIKRRRKSGLSIAGIRISVHKSWLNNLNLIKNCLKEYFDIDANVKINNRGYADFEINKVKQNELLFNEILKTGAPIMERKIPYALSIISQRSNFV